MFKTEFVGPIDGLDHVLTSHVKLVRKTNGQSLFYRGEALNKIRSTVMNMAVNTRENTLIIYTRIEGEVLRTDIYLNGTTMITYGGVI